MSKSISKQTSLLLICEKYFSTTNDFNLSAANFLEYRAIIKPNYAFHLTQFYERVILIKIQIVHIFPFRCLSHSSSTPLSLDRMNGTKFSQFLNCPKIKIFIYFDLSYMLLISDSTKHYYNTNVYKTVRNILSKIFFKLYCPIPSSSSLYVYIFLYR